MGARKRIAYHLRKTIDYDFIGDGAFVLPVNEDPDKYFCSEYVNCIYKEFVGYSFPTGHKKGLVSPDNIYTDCHSATFCSVPYLKIGV